jgi:hypothetical protein
MYVVFTFESVGAVSRPQHMTGTPLSSNAR